LSYAGIDKASKTLDVLLCIEFYHQVPVSASEEPRWLLAGLVVVARPSDGLSAVQMVSRRGIGMIGMRTLIG